MSPPRSKVALVVALGLVLLGALSPAAGAQSAGAESWMEVPAPDPAGLEPAVAEQLEQLRSLVAEKVQDPSVPAVELGEAFGELGRHYHAYDLAEVADACYRIAQRLAPDDFRWPYLAGYLHQSAGRLEAAAGHYERALGIFSEVPPAWIRLGRVYLDLNRPADAERALANALQLDPTSAAAQAELGQVYLSERRYEEAIAALEAALENQPEADLLFYPLALAYRGIGEGERAQSLIARRGDVGVRPADPLIDGLAALTAGERVHLLRGRAAFEAGRFAEATEEFRAAVAAQPDSTRARINLASALAEIDQVEAAMAELREAVRIAPGNATALFNLGSLHERRGEFEAAAERFAEAASYERSDAEIRVRLGDALRRLGRLQDALTHYGRAVALEAGSEAGRIGEADVLARLGRFEEAGNRLETAHQLIPTSGLIAHALARFLAACPDPSLRDGERALRLAEAVVNARPTLQHVRTVALAFAELGQCERAAEWQGRAVEAALEAGDERAAAELDATRARFAAGPPCRPPMAEP